MVAYDPICDDFLNGEELMYGDSGQPASRQDGNLEEHLKKSYFFSVQVLKRWAENDFLTGIQFRVVFEVVVKVGYVPEKYFVREHFGKSAEEMASMLKPLEGFTREGLREAFEYIFKQATQAISAT